MTGRIHGIKEDGRAKIHGMDGKEYPLHVSELQGVDTLTPDFEFREVTFDNASAQQVLIRGNRTVTNVRLV